VATLASDISDRQNEPQSIRLLAAQRQIYIEAKRRRLWRSVVISVVALGGLAVGAVWVGGQALLVALGGVLVLVDWLVASPLQTRKTRQAANVQEQFDTYVLGLLEDHACRPKA
jgi:hypothetical protein